MIATVYSRSSCLLLCWLGAGSCWWLELNWLWAGAGRRWLTILISNWSTQFYTDLWLVDTILFWSLIGCRWQICWELRRKRTRRIQQLLLDHLNVTSDSIYHSVLWLATLKWLSVETNHFVMYVIYVYHSVQIKLYLCVFWWCGGQY